MLVCSLIGTTGYTDCPNLEDLVVAAGRCFCKSGILSAAGTQEERVTYGP